MAASEQVNSRSAELIAEFRSKLGQGTARDDVDCLVQIASLVSVSDARAGREQASDALEQARSLGYEVGQARAMQCLAFADWSCGDDSAALEHAKDCVGRFEALDDLKGLARTYLILGSVYTRQSRLPEATAVLVKAHRLSEAADDRQGAAIALNTLSVLASNAGQLQKALEYRLESAAILEDIGDRYRLAIASINIGRIHREMGDEDKAIEFLGRAIKSLETLEPGGYPIASAYHTVGEMHLRRGRLDVAREYLERALSIREAASDLAGQASSCHALAGLCIDSGDLDTAAALLARGLRMVQEIELPQVEQLIYLALTRLHEAHGDFEQALNSHKRAFELQRRLFDDAQTRDTAEMQARFDAERKEREAEIYQLKYVELQAEVERRRSAERALIQSQKQESLGIMAGGVAHDFNNMLLCVLGYETLALEALPDEHPARQHLMLSQESASRAAELARLMLTYAGKEQYEMVACSLDDVISANHALLASLAGRDARLDVSLHAPISIMADKVQVHQVLSNLVINSKEAGAHVIEVSTQLRDVTESDSDLWEYTGDPLPVGSYAVLSVRDDGDGMSDNVLSRVFDPFFSTKFSGRGLGLAAVLGIIRGHRGGVAVRSEPGAGCVFEFAFPVDSVAALASQNVRDASPSGPSPIP